MRKDNSGQRLDFDRVEAIHGFRTRGQTKVPRYFSSCLIARLSYPGGFPWSRCGYKVKYSTLAASKILPPVELRSTEVPNNTYSTLL